MQRVKRFWKNRLALVGLVIVTGWCVIAIFAPFLTPYDPMEINLKHRLQPPSARHWLGTDFYGRDVLSRIIHGAKYDVIIAVSAVMFAAGIGTPAGVIAGYYGGGVDEIIMRITDVIMAFPSLVLAMALAAVLGPGLEKAIFVMAFVGTAGYARLARGSTLSVKEEFYVEAARAVGSSTPRILFKHILPNIVSPIIVRATLGMGFTVLLAATLSFIGLGITPPTPEWGAMINEGRLHLVTGKWWITTFPGLAIMSLVLGFNLIGDGLRDILDPREFARKY
ncbi:ABC transporter permease [Candidatus Bipolaricaulota bacterium]|nr:ABC transporter permease [Candidatus Bipolaricaulota bacterium]